MRWRAGVGMRLAEQREPLQALYLQALYLQALYLQALGIYMSNLYVATRSYNVFLRRAMQGPTLTMKVVSYSLIRDVQVSQGLVRG